jgi:polyisoprenoid-binding protein YceI
MSALDSLPRPLASRRRKAMKWILLAASLFAIGACSPPASKKTLLTTATDTPALSAAPLSKTAPPPSVEGLPAGAYVLDPAHSTLLFKVSHLGFSNFTMWFDTFAADLQLDPANPGAARLSATVDPSSLRVPAPPAGFLEHLLGEQFIDAATFSAITYRSTNIVTKGKNKADIIGDLTLHGVTKPVTLTATFNGGYVGHVYEPQARIGFSANGTFKRSDFGIGYGVPAPGSGMGTSDEVQVVIEAEFLGPAWQDAPAGSPAAN